MRQMLQKLQTPTPDYVQSHGTAPPGQAPTSHLAREAPSIPSPATTASPVPNLNISQRRCCVRVRGVCVCVFFSVFFGIAPRGAKRSLETSFRNAPRPHSKRPGASFHACTIITPQEAFTHIVKLFGKLPHLSASTLTNKNTWLPVRYQPACCILYSAAYSLIPAASLSHS